MYGVMCILYIISSIYKFDPNFDLLLCYHDITESDSISIECQTYVILRWVVQWYSGIPTTTETALYVEQ